LAQSKAPWFHSLKKLSKRAVFLKIFNRLIFHVRWSDIYIASVKLISGDACMSQNEIGFILKIIIDEKIVILSVCLRFHSSVTVIVATSNTFLSFRAPRVRLQVGHFFNFFALIFFVELLNMQIWQGGGTLTIFKKIINFFFNFF
jgi:hypothetical protein